MKMPGRDVWMSTYSLLAARSMSILETPASEKRLLSYVRSFRSSCNSFE
jgi:hypothetical protein